MLHELQQGQIPHLIKEGNSLFGLSLHIWKRSRTFLPRAEAALEDQELPKTPRLIQLLLLTGKLHQRHKETFAALRCFQRAHQALQNRRDTQSVHFYLGNILSLMGRKQQAQPRLQQALRDSHGIEGPARHLRRANIYHSMGKYQKALKSFKNIPSNLEDVTVDHNRGLAKFHLNMFSEAKDDIEGAKMWIENNLHKEHPWLADIYYLLASIDKEDHGYLHKAYEIHRKHGSSASIADHYEQCASYHSHRKEWFEAIESTQKALKIWTRLYGARHPQTAKARGQMVNACRHLAAEQKQMVLEIADEDDPARTLCQQDIQVDQVTGDLDQLSLKKNE